MLLRIPPNTFLSILKKVTFCNNFPSKGGEILKCQCEICHDLFKESTVKKNYTLVTCQSCHHTFCLKHSTTREFGKFLNAILKELCVLSEPPGTEARLIHRQTFSAVKSRLWFSSDPPGELLTSTETLTPRQMAAWLKEIDEVIAQRLPSVREQYPATLCPFCTLEYIDTDTLLAYCLLELKNNYPYLSMDELMQHLIYQFKQRYQTLEAFEHQFKGEM